MTESTAFGDRFGERLRCERAPAFVSRSLRNTTIAVTEIKSDNPVPGLSSSLTREDAFLVALQLRDYPVHEYWEDGRPAPVTALFCGDTTIYDIKRDPVFNINNPFHSIYFYFPRAALDAIADNAGAPRIGDLRYQPGAGVDDPIMRGLALSLLPAFEHPDQVSQLFAEHLTLAVGAHVARTYGDMKSTRVVHGGLAPWQERRAKDSSMPIWTGHSRSPYWRRNASCRSVTFPGRFVGQPGWHRINGSRIGGSRQPNLCCAMADCHSPKWRSPADFPTRVTSPASTPAQRAPAPGRGVVNLSSRPTVRRARRRRTVVDDRVRFQQIAPDFDNPAG